VRDTAAIQAQQARIAERQAAERAAAAEDERRAREAQQAAAADAQRRRERAEEAMAALALNAQPENTPDEEMIEDADREALLRALTDNPDLAQVILGNVPGKKRSRTELVHQVASYNALKELLPGGRVTMEKQNNFGRTDVESDEFRNNRGLWKGNIVEVKKVSDWKHALGQVISYNHQYDSHDGRDPGKRMWLHLYGQRAEDDDLWIRGNANLVGGRRAIYAVCQASNVNVIYEYFNKTQGIERRLLLGRAERFRTLTDAYRLPDPSQIVQHEPATREAGENFDPAPPLSVT